MIYKVYIKAERLKDDYILRDPEGFTGVFSCFSDATRWAFETLHIISNELGGISRNVKVVIRATDNLDSWKTNDKEDQ